MSDPQYLRQNRAPSSSTETYGPFHSVVMEDIEHIYGYHGTLTSFSKFTGIDLVNGGYGYDPANPPTVTISFKGRDYGVRAEAKVADWTGADGRIVEIKVTDMGLHGSHDPAYPVLALHVTWRGKDGSNSLEVNQVYMDNPGGGYTAPPIISFSEYAGSHTDPVLQAVLAGDGTVAGVTIITRGEFNRNMESPPPMPQPMVSDPPTIYDVYPNIIITDDNENTSAVAYPTAGGIIQLDDPNHTVQVYDSDGRLIFRDEFDNTYQVPGIEITAVTGSQVYFTMHLQDDPDYYNMPASYSQASPRPPTPPAECWFLKAPSKYATATPPKAALGQPGWHRRGGLSLVVLTDTGAGYTPGQTYGVNVYGGTCEAAAGAIGIGQEDGSLRVQITDQGRKYTVTPSVSIAGPPGGAGSRPATGYCVTFGQNTYTVRMHNPWTHGVTMNQPLQVLWKWGTGPWQFRFQCGRYNCQILAVGNGIVTFTGGMNGPSLEDTTVEEGGSDGIAGKAWELPTEDNYLVELFPGPPQKNVRVGVAKGFGMVVAIMHDTVDHDFAIEPLKPDQQWNWEEYWGWFTDLNAKARVS